MISAWITLAILSLTQEPERARSVSTEDLFRESKLLDPPAKQSRWLVSTVSPANEESRREILRSWSKALLANRIPTTGVANQALIDSWADGLSAQKSAYASALATILRVVPEKLRPFTRPGATRWITDWELADPGLTDAARKLIAEAFTDLERVGQGYKGTRHYISFRKRHSGLRVEWRNYSKDGANIGNGEAQVDDCDGVTVGSQDSWRQWVGVAGSPIEEADINFGKPRVIHPMMVPADTQPSAKGFHSSFAWSIFMPTNTLLNVSTFDCVRLFRSNDSAATTLNRLGYRKYLKAGLMCILPPIPNVKSDFDPKNETLTNEGTAEQRLKKGFDWLASTQSNFYSGDTGHVVAAYSLRNRIPILDMSFFPLADLIRELKASWKPGRYEFDLSGGSASVTANRIQSEIIIMPHEEDPRTRRLEEDTLGYAFLIGKDSCKKLVIEVEESKQLAFLELGRRRYPPQSNPIPTSPESFSINGVLIAKNWRDESEKLLNTPVQIVNGLEIRGTLTTKNGLTQTFTAFVEEQRGQIRGFKFVDRQTQDRYLEAYRAKHENPEVVPPSSLDHFKNEIAELSARQMSLGT